MDISTKTLSSSVTTKGEEPDPKWFSSLGSGIVGLAKQAVLKVGELIKSVGSLVKKIGVEVLRLDKLISTIEGWFKKGIAKVKEISGTIIKFGKKAAGWLNGGAAAIVALAAGWGINQLTGVSMANLATSALNQAEIIYNFNFQVTDKDLDKQMKALIDSLYGPAGEFMGRSLAQLIVGGISSPPKVQINIKGLALIWILNPDIRDDLLQNVSQLAHAGIYVFRQIAFAYAFKKGRQAIKAYWKKAPIAMKKIYPGLDKIITTWGDEGKEPWTMESWVEKKIESLNDDRLEDFVEEFLSGFWDGFRDSVEYVYN
ncbi:MAG: hypothetical protein ACOVQ7_11490 [Limnoraphis robusta]|jgi:hypothetical protein